MFVQNKTPHAVVLARSDVSDDLCVGTVVFRASYRVGATGLIPWEGPRAALDSDPPSTAEHAIWEGTSVTVSGVVRGPLRPPHVVRTDLRVGGETRSLLVFGDRQWLRNAGKLVASTPAAFDEKPLSWALAFGGSYELLPGMDPVRKLPHPGGPIPYVLNPGGTGFYPNERAAQGNALPNIERRETAVSGWMDLPRPAGFAPCPELVGLRAPEAGPTGPDDPQWHFRSLLRFVHHAPGDLIFESLAPGTAVRVAGLGGGPVGFEVPRSPVNVTTVRGKALEVVGFRVRSVHASTMDGAVLVDYAHAFGFGRGGAPSWVRVETR